MDLNQLWQLTLNEMEAQLSRASFATWLKNSQLIDSREGVFYIALPNNFAKEWIETKYQKNILGIIRNFDTSARKLEFIVTNYEPKALLRKQAEVDFNKLDAQAGLDLVKVESNFGILNIIIVQKHLYGLSFKLLSLCLVRIIETVKEIQQLNTV